MVKEAAAASARASVNFILNMSVPKDLAKSDLKSWIMSALGDGALKMWEDRGFYVRGDVASPLNVHAERDFYSMTKTRLCGWIVLRTPLSGNIVWKASGSRILEEI